MKGNTDNFHAWPLTRYQFAVAVSRIEDKYKIGDIYSIEFENLPFHGATEKDCLFALHQEFQPEILALSTRDSTLNRQIDKNEIRMSPTFPNKTVTIDKDVLQPIKIR